MSNTNAYDAVEYESHPYKQTHPSHLYTIAKLFGLHPKDFTKARVLELGCASGGNIIPMAFNLPKASFIGIDYSQKQVDHGNNIIKALGLKNIEIQARSILDIAEQDGKFDYIICHGIYSWVPSDVRDKIFQICQANLADFGVAVVSYNTLPGWNMVKSIREMMLYHIQNFDTFEKKAQQARCLLKFLVDGLEGQNTPYANFLRSEIEVLARQPDSYLMHDHLEEVNHPVYFHDFMADAHKNQLSYLADTDLAQMYPGNLQPKFAEQILQINDIVRTNQYMDFVRNQRFRSTLLVKNTVKINRNLSNKDLSEFYLRFNGQIQGTESDMGQFGKEVKFIGAHITLSLTDVLAKLCIYTLATKFNNPVTTKELALKVVKLYPKYNLKQVKESLQGLNLVRLCLGGLILLSCFKPKHAVKLNPLPRATEYSRSQIKSKNYATNSYHEPIGLNLVEKSVLQSCNGKNSFEQIIKNLVQDILDNKVQIFQEDGQIINNIEEVNKRAKPLCENILNKFITNGLLVD